jgi:hypothetical protein
MAKLLIETAKHQGAFGAIPATHDWWNWYATYIDGSART